MGATPGMMTRCSKTRHEKKQKEIIYRKA
jgi:hypothetical protein